MKHSLLLFNLLLIGALLAACAQPTAPPTPTEPRVLRVITHSSFSLSEDVIRAFEQEHNATVQFIKGGDTGTLLNQVILSKDNPPADVLYGVDNTFLSRALNADLFVPYTPKNLEAIPPEFQLDPQHRMVPVDFGDVCLNYDKAYFAEHKLDVPQSLADLTRPEYKGLLVVEDPSTSSPGLAFLLTTIATFGEEGYQGFWQALKANDVLIVNDWDTAYYTEFSGGAYSEGTRPLVVSYATSPAAEVYFSEGKLTTPPTGAIVRPGTCFRQVEFAGILKNGQNRDLAEAFIEALLSQRFQEDIPLQMWVYPVLPGASLPPVFAEHGVIAQEPARLDPQAIEQNRERWIETWRSTMLP